MSASMQLLSSAVSERRRKEKIAALLQIMSQKTYEVYDYHGELEKTLSKKEAAELVAREFGYDFLTTDSGIEYIRKVEKDPTFLENVGYMIATLFGILFVCLMLSMPIVFWQYLVWLQNLQPASQELVK